MTVNQSSVNASTRKKDNIPGCRIPERISRRILSTPGASARIARIAGCSKSYVSAALNGHASASDRLIDAIISYSEAIHRETVYGLAYAQIVPWLDDLQEQRSRKPKSQ